jgi:hypothetical protein
MRALAILGLLLLARPAAAMSVEGAYAAIPHRRTVFDRTTATMSADEAEGLVRLFAMVDRAVVARVTRMGHDAVVADLRALQLPKTLRSVQILVIDAVVAQQAYLVDGKQAAIRAASAHLHAAYAELMRLFPGENAHNRDAFYDYLCALDYF